MYIYIYIIYISMNIIIINHDLQFETYVQHFYYYLLLYLHNRLFAHEIVIEILNLYTIHWRKNITFTTIDRPQMVSYDIK